MWFGIFGPAYAHGSRFDKEQKKGGSFYAAVLITIFFSLFEILSVIELVGGKSGYIYPMIIMASVVLIIWWVYYKNMIATGNPYKKGIRVMGTVDESDKFTPKDAYGYVEAKQYDPCENSYGYSAYRLNCKVINPHTGKEMLCISKGSYENLAKYNLKSIPVYFHKRKADKYYVDIKEAIALKEIQASES